MKNVKYILGSDSSQFLWQAGYLRQLALSIVHPVEIVPILYTEVLKGGL
jgi:hypothetical protein